MIYLIGGAPRAGKSVLGQQLAAKLKVSWISTDLLAELLRVKDDSLKAEWNAENYVIEGVSFLPAQVKQLSDQYQIRSVFLGCSGMTLDRLDQFPGRSQGYSFLPEAMRRQIAQDVPRWSKFIQQEAERFGYPYLDMADDFPQRLLEAEAMLTTAA
jgi:hypothetical protein